MLTYEKTCRFCGKVFKTSNKRALYCSVKCRRAWDNKNKTAKRQAETKIRESVLGTVLYDPWRGTEEADGPAISGNVLEDGWMAEPYQDFDGICISFAGEVLPPGMRRCPACGALFMGSTEYCCTECLDNMREARRLGNARRVAMQKRTGVSARPGGGKPKAAARKKNDARTPGGVLSTSPQEAKAMQEKCAQEKKVEELLRGISYLERAYNAMQAAYDQAFQAAHNRKEGEELFNLAQHYIDEARAF